MASNLLNEKNSWQAYAFRFALLCALYIAAGSLGLVVPYLNTYITLIWAPTGIAIAFLVRYGSNLAWAIIPAQLIMNHFQPNPNAHLVAWVSIGSALGPWVAAEGLRKLNFNRRFLDVRDLFVFIVVAVCAGMVITASNGTLHLARFNIIEWRDFSQAWLRYWLGDAIGVLLFGLPLLTFSKEEWTRAIDGPKRWESFTLLVGLLASFYFIFFGSGTRYQTLPPYNFLPLLLLVWLALRNGIWLTSTVSMILSVLAVIGTARHGGAFESGNVQDGLVLLWTYMATLCFLSALVSILTMKNLRLNDALEHKVSERTRELEQANDEMRSFTYSISHDLRSPIRTVTGYCSVLLEDHGGELSESVRKLVLRIQTTGNSLGQMTDGLLRLAGLGQQELQRADLNLSEMAQDVLHGLRNLEPHRTLTVEIAQNMRAHADAAMVLSLLQNLLTNAWKYTAQSHDARIVFGQLSDASGEWYFVRDNGIGFEQQHADKIFQPFSRLHDKTDYEGEGIGLATVQKIVRRHGGSLRAEGIPGSGASFFFTLGARTST